jgi:hypothetical protein
MVAALVFATASIQENSVASAAIPGDDSIPSDISYVQSITAPTFTVVISVERSGAIAGKKQRVDVVGPLTPTELAELLHLAFDHRDIYWASNLKSIVVVRGDEHRVMVKVSYVCGSLCGSGATYWYTHDESGWRYLYASNSWVS